MMIRRFSNDGKQEQSEVVAEAKPPVKRRRSRRRSFTRNVTYRGISFLLMSFGEYTRVYTFGEKDGKPHYQCSVENAYTKQAIYALAKAFKAEQELQAISAREENPPQPSHTMPS